MDSMSFAGCRYGGCDVPAGRTEKVCFDHYVDYKAGTLDQCPACEKLKSRTSELCQICTVIASGSTPDSARQSHLSDDLSGRSYDQSPIRERRGRYEPERSDAWDRGDEYATIYYAYILKMDGGEFYCGHTRVLRARLSEHRDGKSHSTAGRHPRLVWFTELSTRTDAAGLEASLKELNDRNPREILKMVIRFEDLVREMSDPG